MGRISHTGLIGAAIIAVLLSACSSGKTGKAVRGKSPPPASAAQGPMTARQAEDVWHLRAALNVAALNCRGRGIASVTPGYNRMLSIHHTTLAAAAQSEQARYPGRKYDTHVTQLFNRYSLIRNHRLYCADAQAVVGRVNAASARELVRMAPEALGQLDAAQRRR
jgi:hypothetical protein